MSGSLRFSTMHDVVAHINKNMDSKEELTRCIDSLLRRVGGTFEAVRKGSCRQNRRQLVKEGGTTLILDILARYNTEELLIETCCSVLVRIANLPDDEGSSHTESMLQLGARTIIDECMANTKDDKGLVRPGTQKFSDQLNLRGGPSAVRDIRRQILALEFIRTQDLVQSAYPKYQRKVEQPSADVAYNVKTKKGPEAEMVDWLYTLDYEAFVKQVVAHMNCYKTVLAVQEAGNEAFFEYARCTTDVMPCIKFDGCGAVIRSFDLFPDTPRVIWKASNSVTEMCLQHLALASELGKQGVVQRLVSAWDKMLDANDFAVQQQIVWAIGGLARIPTNVERFKTEGVPAILKYCAVDLPNENKKNRHKGASAQKVPITLPLNLRSLFDLSQLEELVNPQPVEMGKSKVNVTPFRGYRAKKPRFGRAGDDLGVSSGSAMIDDDKKKKKQKGKGAAVSPGKAGR